MVEKSSVNSCREDNVDEYGGNTSHTCKKKYHNVTCSCVWRIYDNTNLLKNISMGSHFGFFLKFSKELDINLDYNSSNPL